MVRGVSDAFMEAFQPHLTVYPNAQSSVNCKVNLSTISNKNGGDYTPLPTGVIRAAAIGADTTRPPTDTSVLDDTRRLEKLTRTGAPLTVTAAYDGMAIAL